MSRLEIRLFGEPQFTYDGEPWRFAAPPRALPLLAYLLLHRGEQISRARLAAMLWPDDPDDTARSNLRRHLHRIAQALPSVDGVSWLGSTSATISWNERAPAWVDVLEFERLISDRSTAAQGVQLYRGELLETLYDDWVLIERERIRTRALNTIYDLTTAARLRRDYAEAIAYSERMLAIDEWREDALRALISARYESGDRSAALAVYERFASRLHAEMRVDPMPETVALRDAILNHLPIPLLSDDEGVEQAPTAHRAFHLPFVGREDAIEKLRSTWMRAARNSGSMLFVTGEPGIGKSRLATELTAIVEAQGGRTLLGLTSFPESMPYQPLVDALRRGLPYIANAEIDPLWLSVIAALVPEVLSMRPGLSVAVPIDAEHARARLHEAFVRIFEGVARARPLVLIFEDLHWAQKDTLDALILLARRAGGMPLVIVATYRDETVEPALREARHTLQRERRAAAIVLSRLTEEHVVRIVEHIPELTDAPPELAARVFGLSEGNPLFAAHLLESYAETGEMPDEKSGISAVSEAIAQRVQRLDPEVRAVADVAATIGREFTVDLVGQVGGWREDAVLAAIGLLMDRHLVRETGVPDFEYGFTHALVANTIYDRTDADLRLSRHRRIAQCLEQRQNSDAISATIAHHWKLGGDRDRSSAAYARAARGAMNVYARADAIEYGRQALSVCDDPRRRFDVLSVLVQAQQHHGEVEPWDRDLSELEAAAVAFGDEERFFALEARERYYFQTADRIAQRRTIEEMRQLAHLRSELWRAKALDALGMFEIGVGEMRQAIDALREALEAANASEDRAMINRVRQHLITALMRSGEMDAARSELEQLRAHCAKDSSIEEHLDLLWAESSLALATEDAELLRRVGSRMLELSTRFGDEDLQAKAHWMLGWAAITWHELAEGRAHYESAAMHFERLRQPQSLAATLINLGVMALDLGKLDEAIDYAERGAALAEQCGSVNVLAYALTNQADAERLRGNLFVAYDLALRAYRTAVPTSEHRLIATCLSTLGAVKCAMGDVDSGFAHLRECVQLWRVSQSNDSLANDLCLLIELLFVHGDREELIPLARELSDIVKKNSNQRHPARVCWALATAARVRGDMSESTALEERAYKVLSETLDRYADEEAKVAYRALPFNQVILSAASASGLDNRINRHSS